MKQISPELLKEVTALRRELHNCPELSEQEVETRAKLIKFVKEHTQAEIVDKGRWFYAVQREEGAQETILLRAEHDAILGEDGRPYHGCGHDGHSAILAGTAAHLSGQRTGKNIIYLFQHAEENGVGGQESRDILNEVPVDRMYALHNFPGYPLGQPFTRAGTIMCASKGLILRFQGQQAHASEPENSRNPAYAIGELLRKLAPLAEFHGFKPVTWEGHEFSSMVLGTVIYVQVGRPAAFGVAAGQGEVGLTLRAEKAADLEKLDQVVRQLAEGYAQAAGIQVAFTETDVFPDTSNDPAEVERVRRAFAGAGITLLEKAEPYRGSEDFGWLLQQRPGCYFCVGAGEEHPGLHTPPYEFPDELLERGITLFSLIALQ